MKTLMMRSAAAIAFGCALIATPVLADDMTASPTTEQLAAGGIKASEVIGTDVKNPNGDTVGEISELVLDTSGATQGVIVDVGGFLGVGAKPVLLGWDSLSWTTVDGDMVATTAMTKEQLEGLQTYDTSTN